MRRPRSSALKFCALIILFTTHANTEPSPEDDILQLRSDSGESNVTDTYNDMPLQTTAVKDESESITRTLPLRPDDGDSAVGGAGRSDTCLIPSSTDYNEGAFDSEASSSKKGAAENPDLILRGGDGQGAGADSANTDHDSHASQNNPSAESDEERDIASMSGREIREELKALHVSTAGCVEKADFVAKLREARAALKSRRVEAPATAPGPAAEAETPPLRGGGAEYALAVESVAAALGAGVRVSLFSHALGHGTPDAVFPNNWFSTHVAAATGKVPIFFFFFFFLRGTP